MKLFRSIGDNLDHARASKTKAEAEIVELERECAELLNQDDDQLSKVAVLRRQIADRRSSLVLWDDRIAVLEEKLRRQQRAQREELKRKWLAEIEKRFGPIMAAAEEMDRGLKMIKAANEKLAELGRNILDGPNHGFLPNRRRTEFLVPSRFNGSVVIDRFLMCSFDVVGDVLQSKQLLLEVLNETPIPDDDDREAA
jgi:hypothetical protein